MTRWVRTISSHNSGAAGACAGCDGITTAQKLSKGTQNLYIPSVRPSVDKSYPPNLGQGGPKFVSKMEHFVRKSRRNFEKILRFFLMKILELVNKTSATDQFKNNLIYFWYAPKRHTNCKNRRKSQIAFPKIKQILVKSDERQGKTKNSCRKMSFQ